MKLIFCATLILQAVWAHPSVKTSLGVLNGKIEKVANFDVETFRGIPFARPPVGELRFALPVPFGDIGNFDATKTSTICPQQQTPLTIVDHLVENEDCLKLNIYRKSGTLENSKKPVIIIVHGSGYSYSSASDSFQTAISLAAYEDLIIVSSNYRLGILGFADMEDLAPGNLGLHDQLLAFRWVHENIGAFGGDSNKVTLMGVSAGSMSIGAHLITPLRNTHLFQSVIMDAGAVNGYGYIEDSATSFKRVQLIAKKINCPADGTGMLKCLRERDVKELINESVVKDFETGLSTFVATRDGKFIPRNLEDFMKETKFAKTRMIIGYAKNEGTMFSDSKTLQNNEKFSKDEFLKWIDATVKKYNYPINLNDKEQTEKLFELYYNNSAETFNLTAEIQGDGIFICPINFFVKQFAKQQNEIFVYEFGRKVQQTYYEYFNPNVLGVFHGSSYLHFSGSVLAHPNVQTPDLDKQFFLDSMKFIGNFVRSNAAPTLRNVPWPNYSQTGEILLIDEMPTVRNGLTHEEKCALFFEKRKLQEFRNEL